MTIRKRLILSYLAMLLVPFILIILTGGVLRYLSAAMDGSTLGPFSNSRNSHFPMSDNDVLTHFNEVIINSPSLLFSNDYMSNLETDLNLPGAFAVIQQGNIMYISSWMSSTAVMEAIYRKSLNSNNIGFRRHKLMEVLFHWEFSVPDQPNAILYYIIDPAQLFNRYFLTGLVFILAVALVLIVTNGTLTYMVSRSIIFPLKELEKAAIKIRDGDLDNPVICKADDEMRDVFSSFNEMRERLKDSLETQISYEENRKELIASISHDLKTPLTVLKGYVEGLKDGVANTDEKKIHYLDTIYQKAHLMDHLIDDLFLFSRLEMDKYPFYPVSVELSEWLADAIADLSIDYPEIDFQTNLTEKALISADPAELFRVISNIVQNSHNYTGRKDIIITFTLKITDRQVQIIIQDNGSGVPIKQLPFIFDQFYQADESRSRNSRGSGLGLSIANMIVNQHKGSIRAESPRGKGLAVILTLPLISEMKYSGDNQ